jgi:hypothetical protein
VESHKKSLMEELHVLDGLEEVRALVDEEKLRKILVISELENALLMGEISWRQNSRAFWLKEGDKCTKFFPWVANSNRRNNAIEVLAVDGPVSFDQSIIRAHVVQYCDRLFSE